MYWFRKPHLKTLLETQVNTCKSEGEDLLTSKFSMISYMKGFLKTSKLNILYFTETFLLQMVLV